MRGKAIHLRGSRAPPLRQVDRPMSRQREDLSAATVSAGMAWVCTRYSSDYVGQKAAIGARLSAGKMHVPYTIMLSPHFSPLSHSAICWSRLGPAKTDDNAADS